MRTLRLTLAILVGASLGALSPRARGAEEVWLRSWDAHGRPVSLADMRGKVVALTFAGKKTRDEATEINDELSAKAGQDFEVLSSVDLEDIPDFGRGTARKKIAEADVPGALEHVVDAKGQLRRSFNAPMDHVTILVIDKRGELRGRYEGLAELQQAEKQIEELRSE